MCGAEFGTSVSTNKTNTLGKSECRSVSLAPVFLIKCVLHFWQIDKIDFVVHQPQFKQNL